MLQVEDLSAGYREKEVLRGVSLAVGEGEIVAVVGHNGAGKTTLLRVLYGLLPAYSGSVTFGEHELTHQGPRERIVLGMRFLPQGHRVFSDLTVQEHLELAARVLRGQDGDTESERLESAVEWFPRLKPLLRRYGHSLSGGERQTLALAQALIGDPRLLLLDEPSAGLQPRAVGTTFELLHELASFKGVTMIIVEQKVKAVLGLAHSVCVLRRGCVTFRGDSAELDGERLRSAYL